MECYDSLRDVLQDGLRFSNRNLGSLLNTYVGHALYYESERIKV